MEPAELLPINLCDHRIELKVLEVQLLMWPKYQLSLEAGYIRQKYINTLIQEWKIWPFCSLVGSQILSV